MKKLFIFVITFFTLAGSFAFPQPAFACSCVAPGTPLQELAAVDAVFIGKVMGGGTSPIYNLQNYLAQYFPFIPYHYEDKRNYSFYVVQSWKGVDQNAITIQTGSGDGDCGYTFTQTKDYLVYARHTSDGNYTTSICSRTSEVLYAATDMVYLNGLPLIQLQDTYRTNSLIYLGAGIIVVILLLISLILYRRKRGMISPEK